MNAVNHSIADPVRIRLLIGLVFWLVPRPVWAYVPDDPWSVTASGVVTTEGAPITLTWSFAPDGTNIPGEGSSDLVDYFDDLFSVSSGGSDLTQRPWFTLFEQSFDRWSELGGISFVYEPNDNGAQLQSTSGVLGVRGDVRIGGAFVDGASGAVAYAWLPDSGDIVVDTGETDFYSNPTNNFRQLRNTIMHEVGHTFGLLHVESSTDALLLEPVISTSFDGPQLDDIRGLHGLYGDVYEKTNSGLGNGSYDLATSLGSLSFGTSLSIGSDAAIPNQTIVANATDFVSIANTADADYFSFTISAPGILDVSLTPLGGVFSQGVEGGSQSSFNANARNDLSLAVFDTNGASLLGLADDSVAGLTESLSSLTLSSAGEYFVRVLGASDAVQLYELELLLSQPPNVLPGDYNSDGVVDGADLSVWENLFGQSVPAGTSADANGNGAIDGGDFLSWQSNFTNGGSGGNLVVGAAVPGPSTATLGIVAATVAFVGRRPRGHGWCPIAAPNN